MSSGSNSERHPIFDAAKHGSAEAVQELLAAGADPRALDDNHWTPLHAAAWGNDWPEDVESSVIRQKILAIAKAGGDPNARDESGWTPLFVAVSGDGPSASAVAALLELGADPAIRDANGRTVLDEAVEANAYACARVLVRAGALRGVSQEGLRALEKLARETLALWQQQDPAQYAKELAVYGVTEELSRAAAAQQLHNARAMLELLSRAKSGA